MLILRSSIKQLIKRCSSNGNNLIVGLKPPWDVLFFGTDEFSVASLKGLHKQLECQKLLRKLEVVTSFKSRANPIRKFAESNGLPLHDWPNLPADNFHLGLVVSFGNLIPEAVINRFPLGMLNVHASLLPRWRGAAPIIYAIANGDTRTGVTIMQIRPKHFDVGEIVSQRDVEISDHVKMPQLYALLANMGAEELVTALTELPHNLSRAKPQPSEGVTFAPRVTQKMAHVDWNKMSAKDVYNLDRALTGLFPLHSSFNGVVVKLYNVCKCSDVGAKPGSVVYDKGSRTLQIRCADGRCVSVDRIGVQGKKVMSAPDFANGYMKHCDTVVFE